MSKDAPIVRQWLLLKMHSVRSAGVTIREMADELQVVDKTIRL